MTRRLDWPERLHEALELAGARGFSADYACFQFAADVVLAMTDADPLPDGYRGLAPDLAYGRMRRQGYSGILALLEATLGPPIALAMAQRGDVVLRGPERDGELEAIGICIGQRSAFLAIGGIALRPTLSLVAAFAIS
jgi:hypothetical protein